MAEYTSRILDNELDDLLPELPAIVIEGPKWVGKTETAKRRANTVYKLNKPEQNQVISASPEQVLQGEEPILIDEWQLVPETWDIVKEAVDNETRPGRFLLTGSTLPTERPTHSGAGRIVKFHLRPFSMAERQLADGLISVGDLLNGSLNEIKGKTDIGFRDYVQEIVQSGFPELREKSKRARHKQLKGYLDRVVDTDFEQLGHTVRKPETLKRWMRAYAAATSTTASYEKIRDAATSNQDNKPSEDSTVAYREKLEQLYLMDTIPAWTPSANEFKRLTGSEKHFLCDPALSTHMLGLEQDVLLKGKEPDIDAPYSGRWLGRLFEALVTQSVRVYAEACGASVYHLRTKGGREEVDLIIQRADNRILALEVKLSSTIDGGDMKHLKWLGNKAGEKLIDSGIIYTGSMAYRDNNVAVIPAALLGP